MTETSSASIDKKLGSYDLRLPKSGAYVITPTFSQGVSKITFWQCRSASRTISIYTSIDSGTNWTKHSDVAVSSAAIATVTINNPFVNRIKIANEGGSDADIDDLAVYHNDVVWKENYESYTDVSQISSAWINNGSNYQATLELCSNQYGNSSKWLLTYSGNGSRQTTEYYMFASAYTGKAYRFDAKLNMNDGNNNSSESRLYFMNGSKSSINDDPSNYIFYIGVDSDGKVYVSNGTDTETSTIGGLTSGTNSIAASKWSKTYKSTGWFDVSCVIDFEQGKVKVTLSSGNTNETFNISLKSGTKQLSGLCVRGGTKIYGVVALDDLALYELTYPAFTLSDDSKSLYVEDDATVSVTGITGEISVESDDTDVATVSYDAGTITIRGAAEGTAKIKVDCSSDGLKISKTIDVTIAGFVDKYTAAKTVYDTKVANLDAAGQAYWTANVTEPATVTTSETYATAVAALPTTYVAAVKEQGAGSNMTDAVENANCETVIDWGAVTAWSSTSDQFHGNTHSTEVTQISTPFAESWVWTGENAGAVLADQTISHATISGLQAGTYRVTGFIRAASEGDHSEDTPAGFSLYANEETSSTTEGITSSAGLVYGTYSVDVALDGTEDLTFGVKVKDANFSWVAFKNFTLTYLGTEKKTYTINAVAGEATIKELATGSAWASETYGTYIPYVIEYNTQFYVLDDEGNTALDGYYAGYVKGSSAETMEINYTLDESIVAYTEGVGSGYRNVVGSNNSAFSGGDYINNNAGSGLNKRNRGFDLGTLPKGIYQMVAYVVNSGSKRSVALRNIESETTASDPIIQITNSGKITGELTANFQLTESTKLRVNGANSGTDKNNQMEEIDYVLIRKTGEIVNLNASGYATFSTNKDVEVSGAKAYTAALDFENSTITCAEITSNKVPAGNGVLLYGDAGATVTLSYTTEAAELSNNNLKATTLADGTLATKGSNDYYALSGDTFKTFTGDAFVHNKAYFEVEGGTALTRSMRIVFGDNITGVANVEAAAEATLKDGKFIEDGKLVIVKNGKKYNANGAEIK